MTEIEEYLEDQALMLHDFLESDASDSQKEKAKKAFEKLKEIVVKEGVSHKKILEHGVVSKDFGDAFNAFDDSISRRPIV